MNKKDALYEACARAMFEIIAKDNTNFGWIDLCGIIKNMNSGVFGEKERLPESKLQIQNSLRDYLGEQQKEEKNITCDICGCTPCDCHWGNI